MSSHWLIWSLIACLATSPPLPTLPGDTPNLTPDSSSGFLLRPNCGNRAAATIAVIAFVVGPANPRPLLNEAGAVPHCPRKGGETGIRTKSQGRNRAGRIATEGKRMAKKRGGRGRRTRMMLMTAEKTRKVERLRTKRLLRRPKQTRKRKRGEGRFVLS